MTHATYESPVGRLILVVDGGQVVRLALPGDPSSDMGDPGSCGILEEALGQLGEYFAGARYQFDLPISPRGTEFQRGVWDALVRIPYARTATYSDIASMVGHPKAARAVGQANNRNPIPVVIPCHRVIGSGGALVGYRGGLEVKQRLLELERTYA
jgi:methylated-DNA-[protein]-cysteine S-methyltransferase